MPTCLVCGYEAADSFRFCPECGTQADGQARERRKVVTVLFCDVVGSTALGESLDPEALRATLARYFERMKSIVERHGGVVEKFIGDAAMAVFGIPTVHEDDALRAVRAACELREALAKPSEDLTGRHGIPLQVQPFSTPQFAAQPSPAIVAPSSHCSPPTIR